jgi:hypothetical protein
MGHEQIVVTFGRRPRRDVLMEELDRSSAATQFPLDPFLRQAQHALARIETIDLNSGMEPQQFAKESPIPLAYDQRTPRRRDVAETRDATALKIVTKCDPLQRPIPGRDCVEAHAFMINNAIRGVSKTRSASAVR